MTQIAINGVEFTIASDGFRRQDAERDTAINNLLVALRARPTHELRSIDDDTLQSMAHQAVRDATPKWRCWIQRDYYGDFPALIAGRLEAGK